jgi:hypothetical protein
MSTLTGHPILDTLPVPLPADPLLPCITARIRLGLP